MNARYLRMISDHLAAEWRHEEARLARQSAEGWRMFAAFVVALVAAIAYNAITT